jgi:hypothetical protein
LSYRDELQAHTELVPNVPHNRLCSDLSFFDKKIDLCFGPDGRWFMCLKKNPAEAQISCA